MKRQNNKNESKFYIISIRWKIIKNNTFLYPKPVKKDYKNLNVPSLF
jgi:hypothetical protein